MIRLNKSLAILLLVAAFGLALNQAQQAKACPNCKTMISEDAANQPSGPEGTGDAQANKPDLARGFYWSILLMMPIPYLLTAGVGFGVWYHIRKNRAAVEAMQHAQQNG